MILIPSPGLGAESSAGQASDRLEVITDMWSAPARCSLKTAKPVMIKQLVAEPEGLRGTCVVVRGYWQGRALFETGAVARKAGSNSDEAFAAGRVGLYGYEVLDSRRPSRGLFTAVGMAGDCDSVVRGAMMVMGYCHYTDGPYIALSQLTPVR